MGEFSDVTKVHKKSRIKSNIELHFFFFNLFFIFTSGIKIFRSCRFTKMTPNSAEGAVGSMLSQGSRPAVGRQVSGWHKTRLPPLSSPIASPDSFDNEDDYDDVSVSGLDRGYKPPAPNEDLQSQRSRGGTDNTHLPSLHRPFTPKYSQDTLKTPRFPSSL